MSRLQAISLFIFGKSINGQRGQYEEGVRRRTGSAVSPSPYETLQEKWRDDGRS